MSLNPDFRSADDVIVPGNLVELTGWTDGKLSAEEAYAKEQAGFDRLANDMPVAFRTANPQTPDPAMLEQWNKFQQERGRYPGSCDWSLLDEFIFKTVILWLPQIIGSCVVSNSLRPWVARLCYQIALLGMPMEYLGRDEFGTKNLSFYGPFSYGAARKRANMLRGGDGLYCEPMAESFLKDGVLACNTPALLEILKAAGHDKPKDFPEPQNARFYREWGAGKYLEQVRQYADFVLLECPPIKSADELKAHSEAGRTAFFCSMIAVHKIGTHKDGFAIHGRNPNDRWAHNMSFQGFFAASDGDVFFRFCNQSWGEKHIYNVPFSQVVDWFRNRQPSSCAIGTINGPRSAPPLIGV